MNRIIYAAALMVALSVGVSGQDGKDISSAIPIYFDQVVTDIGDAQASPVMVYKITAARGQKFTAAATTPNGGGGWQIRLAGPSARNVNALTKADIVADPGYNSSGGIRADYLVPVAGVYYVILNFEGRGINYSLQVTAEGTPIAVPNPASAGCLTGRVDSMLYSLQRIAAGLPDEVTIGGQRACATCTVKSPLYPEISNRLEAALRSGINVEACYDSAGSIFQLKMLRQ